MEFKIGQNVKINDLTYRISAFVKDFALAVEISKGIVDGGYTPIILTLNEDRSKVVVVTDENIVKDALRQILTNGKFV